MSQYSHLYHKSTHSVVQACTISACINNFVILSTQTIKMYLKILKYLYIFETKPALNRELSPYPPSIMNWLYNIFNLMY